MVKIRLRRMGAKKAPYYRIVVADSRCPRDGRFIEEIGTYNPLTNPSTAGSRGAFCPCSWPGSSAAWSSSAWPQTA